MDGGLSSMILLIGGLIVATLVVGVIFTSSQTLSNGITDLSDSKAENLRTDIEIISDKSANAIYNNSEITILVKNTGSTELDSNQPTLQVDGKFVNISSSTVVDGKNWDVNNVLRITATKSLDTNKEHIFTVDANGETASIKTVITND